MTRANTKNDTHIMGRDGHSEDMPHAANIVDKMIDNTETHIAEAKLRVGTPGTRIQYLINRYSIDGTTTDFAKRSGFPEKTIAGWIDGSIQITGSDCVALQKEFGVSADWIKGANSMFTAASLFYRRIQAECHIKQKDVRKVLEALNISEDAITCGRLPDPNTLKGIADYLKTPVGNFLLEPRDNITTDDGKLESENKLIREDGVYITRRNININKIMKMPVYARICILCKRRGIDIIDLPRAARIPYSLIGLWGDGKAMNNKYLQKVANYFNTTTEYLTREMSGEERREIMDSMGGEELFIRYIDTKIVESRTMPKRDLLGQCD